MKEKRTLILTGFRILCMILVLAALYRKEKIDIFFTAVSVTAIAFWVLPGLLTQIVIKLFKVKGEYGGTLLYDDNDPTDCRFRMVFDFDPEFLIGKDEFAVKVEKADLMNNRDQNND